MLREKITIGNCAFSFIWPGIKKKPEVFFHHTTRPVQTWKNELGRAAESIAQSTSRPLWLALSGGIDSEVMAQSFFAMKIPFQPFSIRHCDNGNLHDIEWAIKWCKAKGLELKILEIDFLNFLKEDIPDMEAQEEFSGLRVFRHFQLWILKKIEALGGLAVLGGGEQLYRVAARVPPAEAQCLLEISRDILASLELTRQLGQPHTPYFHMSTPELIAAYQEIAVVRDCLTQPQLFLNRKNSMVFKRFVYHSEFPEMEQRQKYNGFEKIWRLVDEINERNIGNPSTELICEILVSDIRKQLYPET